MLIVLMGHCPEEEILNLIEEFQEEDSGLLSRLNFKRVETPESMVMYASETSSDAVDGEGLAAMFRGSETAQMGNLMLTIYSTTTTKGAVHVENTVISHDLGVDSHKISVEPKR